MFLKLFRNSVALFISFSLPRIVYIVINYLFLFIYIPNGSLFISQLFCLWSIVHCYCQLWLRTQEGHHLVTRCLSPMLLWGDLATTVLAFGVSPVNICWHMGLSQTRTHKALMFLDIFFVSCDKVFIIWSFPKAFLHLQIVTWRFLVFLVDACLGIGIVNWKPFSV